MARCDGAHRQLDSIANGAVQVGELPVWTRVRGPAAWYVAQGPLTTLPAAWGEFHRKVAAAVPGRPDGPPGYVFACMPEEHAGAADARILTIMYLPIEEGVR